MNYLFVAGILSSIVAEGSDKPELGNFLDKFNEASAGFGRQSSWVPELRIFSNAEADEVKPKFKYPFLGFIRIDKHTDQEYLCSGTLLDSQSLLTSAHCVTEDYVRFFKVSFHRHNKKLKSKSENGTEHRFRKVIAHESYELKDGIPSNDIALVRLATPVPRLESKASLNYIRLPSTKLGNPPSDVELTIVGWGLSKPKGEQSDVLRHAEKLHLTDECYTKDSGLTKEQHLCATNAGNADPCSNDSGGPLLAPATDDGFIQIGIIPSQPKCGSSKKPGVYTRILGQVNWIKSTQAKLSA
ncbi:Epidermal growth factor-binding protein type B [Entomophthora muscae]|uniref:Epidermal growth factor-binding protein type B n=1 Tax=Entomophthora muscae TaxID=34485 RepID=A0ACC2TFT0_9FUNG|nr:Epidermal growth factor-binding protein type B [Entomophthora muscae]